MKITQFFGENMRKLLWLLLLAAPLSAQTGVEKLIPQATPFVTDAAHLYSDQTVIDALNRLIRSNQQQTGGDIAILTLPTIGDYQPYEVAMTAGRLWKVGGKAPIGSDQRNLGVVILLVPHTASHKGQCFISTGWGAEGFITDGKAGELCTSQTELFKKGEFGAATVNLIREIGGLMVKNVTPPKPIPPEPFNWLALWMVLGCILLVSMVIGVIVYRQNKKLEAKEALDATIRRGEQVKRDREQAARDTELFKLAESKRLAAEAAEKKRWDALTPTEQTAEKAALAAAAAAALILATKRRKQEEEDEEEQRKRRRRDDDDSASSYSSPSSYSSDSGGAFDGGGGSSDSFGGGGEFDGGGGGSSF